MSCMSVVGGYFAFLYIGFMTCAGGSTEGFGLPSNSGHVINKRRLLL